MKINLTSIPVNDQAKALAFYTDVLGFQKNKDIAMGEHRWLTVVSPDGIEGVELLLEPLGFPPSIEYYKALYDNGVAAMMFESVDINREYEALRAKGVVFRGEPKPMGEAVVVLFDDTCGNLICLAQPIT